MIEYRIDDAEIEPAAAHAERTRIRLVTEMSLPRFGFPDLASMREGGVCFSASGAHASPCLCMMANSTEGGGRLT
jgi:hypothetical protein